MKKIYLVLSLAFAAATSFGQSKVTFQVDMNGETVSSAGVSVAGDFQAADGATADWTPGATVLTDGDNDGVYTYTATIPDGTYSYKFLNGDAWGTDESVPGACAVSNNRQVVVSGDMTIDVVCFGLCIACPTAIDTADVVLKVDMSMQTVSANGVHVAGDFAAGGYAAWDPSAIALTDADNDNVYEVTLRLPQGSYPFKFVNGNAWGSDEGIPQECAVSNNREVTVMGDNDEDSELLADKVMYLSAFGMCPPSDSTDVTFKVDLNYQDISTDGVHMAGDFAAGGYPSWDPAGIALTDADNDKVYEVTLRLPTGSYPFKFVNGNAWGSDEGVPGACVVNGNREMVVADNGDAFSDILTSSMQVCFGKCEMTCAAPLPPVKVTFRVDLNDEIVNANGVFVAGDFMKPAWDKDSLSMTDGGNGVYYYTIEVVPGEYQFKYFNGDQGDDDGETADFATAGCGAANAVGGWNRVLNIEGQMSDTTLPAWKFNSCDMSTASINDALVNNLSIYPNPAKQSVQVALGNGMNNFTATLLDLTGRVIATTTTAGNKVTLSWGSVNAGLYIVHVTDATGKVATQKLLID